MRNLVVAELQLELAILAESGQITLVVIKGPLRLERHILFGMQDAVKMYVRPPDVEAIAQVAVLVELGSFQKRIERRSASQALSRLKVWPAVDVAPGIAHSKIDESVIRLLLLILILVGFVLACNTGRQKQERQNRYSGIHMKSPHFVPLLSAGMRCPTGDWTREWPNG